MAQLFRGQAISSKATMQKQSSQDSHSSHGTSKAAVCVEPSPCGATQKAVFACIRRRRPVEAASLFVPHAAVFRRKVVSQVDIRTHQDEQPSAARTNREHAREMEETISARGRRPLFAPSRSMMLADLSPLILVRSTTEGRQRHTGRRCSIFLFAAEYEDKAPQEIRAEINVVQAEGDRMLGTFVALEETLTSKHSTLDPLVLSAIVDR